MDLVLQLRRAEYGHHELPVASGRLNSAIKAYEFERSAQLVVFLGEHASFGRDGVRAEERAHLHLRIGLLLKFALTGNVQA